MPRGKASVHGGLINRVCLPDLDVGKAQLDEARLKKLKAEPFVVSDEQRARIIDAIEVYIGSLRGSDATTATVRTRAMQKVSSAADRLSVNPTSESWRERLDAAWAQLDLNAKSSVNRALTAAARAEQTSSDGMLLVVRLLEPDHKIDDADLRVLKLVSEHCRMPQAASDNYPYLTRLVSELAIVWREITRRSPLGTRNTNNHPFANWVMHLTCAADTTLRSLPEPIKVQGIVVLRGSVVDELRRAKKRTPKAPL